MSTQAQTAAQVVELSVAIGLQPVITNNPGYRDSLRSLQLVLVAIDANTVITRETVTPVLLRAGIAAQDAEIMTGVVVVAWNTWTKQHPSTLRPDVAIWVKAVSDGVDAALAATAK